MRKYLSLFIAGLLIASVCFAQGGRDPEFRREGKSDFNHIGMHGLNTAGNPGYIELRGGSKTTSSYFYLWVSENGVLMITSEQDVWNISAFPDGDFLAISGVAVGAQSAGSAR